MQSRWLNLYVATTVATAAAAVVLLPLGTVPLDWPALGLLILLSCIAGARPVRFVGKGNEVTATHAAIICALATLGPLPAVLTAVAGLAATFALRSRSLKLLRVIFNSAAIVLSAAASSHAFMAFGGVPGDLRTMLFWPLLAATGTYFFINTGLVSIAVAIERGRSVRRVWDGLAWTAASYFTGVILALGLVAAYDYQGPLGLAVGLPPIWVLLNFYSAHRGNLEEKERRIEEAEYLNCQLQAKIDELQVALDEVHELRALLPICMHCKSIRDDDNTWHRIESYISKHYDADFTHSLCDGCRETHYDVPSRGSVAGTSD